MHENFTKDEFKCKCGNCDKGFDDINKVSLGRLFTARTIAGVPFILNETVRCYTWNVLVGGVEDSSHLYGKGFDIKATNSSTRYTILFALRDAGFTRFGVYDGYIHADDDSTKPPKLLWLAKD